MSRKCRAKNPETCRHHGTKGKVVVPVAKKRSNSTTARQAHGFRYEDRVIERFNLTKFGNATAAWDAKTSSGKLVNIKTKKYRRSVEFGSWHRHLEIKKDFFLVIGFWYDSKSEMVEELIIDVPANEWKKNFPLEYGEKIAELFYGVSHDRSWDSEWKRRMAEFQRIYQERKRENEWIVNLSPKRDHKGNLRMQCSVPYSEIKKLHGRFGVTELL